MHAVVVVLYTVFPPSGNKICKNSLTVFIDCATTILCGSGALRVLPAACGAAKKSSNSSSSG
jgi:hypothetical protein